MPSPFPGMDPYVEGQIRTSFHNELASTIVRVLAPKLRPRYIALFEKRYVADDPYEVNIGTAVVQPDVSIHRTGFSGSPRGTATLEPPPLQMETVVPELAPQITVEIRDAFGRELVTSVEILSPANKRGQGRELYLRKRNRILSSNAHLVEIDLCRIGTRVPMRERLPDAPYFVIATRVETRPRSDVWPIQLSDRLPVIPIPLRLPDNDVDLDLQSVFTITYDACGFDLAVDYSAPLRLELSDSERALVAESLLRLEKPD